MEKERLGQLEVEESSLPGFNKEYFDTLELELVPYEYELVLTKEEYAVIKNLLIRFLRPIDNLRVDPEFKIWEEVSEPYALKSKEKWPYDLAREILCRLMLQEVTIN